MKLKLDKSVYKYAKGHLGICPLCFIVSKKREPQYFTQIHVYRSSHTSITLRCKRCNLQFTVTWRTFAEAIENWKTLVQEDTNRKAYFEKIHSTLKLCVDIKHQKRTVKKIKPEAKQES